MSHWTIYHTHSYDYHCVIYGWDDQCEMSQGWIVQMGVDRLPLGFNQPFYNVLVEDGSNRYAAQGKKRLVLQVNAFIVITYSLLLQVVKNRFC